MRASCSQASERKRRRPASKLLVVALCALPLSGCMSVTGLVTLKGAPYAGTMIDLVGIMNFREVPLLGGLAAIDFLPSAALDTALFPFTGTYYLIDKRLGRRNRILRSQEDESPKAKSAPRSSSARRLPRPRGPAASPEAGTPRAVAPPTMKLKAGEATPSPEKPPSAREGTKKADERSEGEGRPPEGD